MITRRSAAACFALLTLACADGTPSAFPSGPELEVSDATTGGASHFYWLAPVDHSPVDSGEFHTGLAPHFEVCRLADTVSVPRTCDGAPIRAWGSEEVIRWLAGEAYYVSWNTADVSLELSWHYRARVFLGATELGFLDLQPVTTPVALPDRHQFRPGGSMNLKVRIERGVLCDLVPVDCGVTAIGPEGGLAPSDSGFGGALFPPGAVEQTVNVIVQRQLDRPCLPTDLLQFDGCFTFETEPPLASFQQPVIVGVCLDPDADLSHEQRDQLLIHKFEEDDPDSVVTATDNVFVGFLTCTAFESASRSDESPLMRLARGVTDGLFRGTPVRPRAASAVHRGLGSTVGSFSQGGWALPALMTLEAGDGQSAPAGTAVPVDPAVRLRDSLGGPIEGMVVRFAVTGGGAVARVEDTTDASGIASPGTWTLGAAGPNSVVASSRGPVGSPITFTATATAAAPPVIDGVLTPGEWDAATAYPFTANVSGGGVPATLHVLPLGETLYLAVSFSSAAGQVNDLRLDFDGDGDGSPGLRDDAIVVRPNGTLKDLHLTASCLRSRQSSCGLEDVSAGGTTDGRAATGAAGATRVYELARPLAGTDLLDLRAGPGDAFGLFLTLQLGNGAQGNTQWPGFRVYLPVTVP